MRGLVWIGLLVLAGCGLRGLGDPLPLRQDGIVIYLTDPVIRPAPDSASLRAACDWLVLPSITERLRNGDDTDRAGHFGVVYAKFAPLPDGLNLCSFATDWNGGSIEDIASSVALRCDRAEGAQVPCAAMYEILPAGYDPALGPSLGDIAGRQLLSRLDEAGYGAVALSRDGAWSVRAGYDSRVLADEAAVSGCRSVVGKGITSLTVEETEQLAQSCTLVFRFGDDAPAQGRVTVIQ